MIGYELGQSGCRRDNVDERDYSFGAGRVDWTKEYRIPFVQDPGNQNGSLSCVGQTFSKYAEVLNAFYSKFVDLSAKWIYGQIYLPEGGAQLRDAAKLLKKSGVCEEDLCCSYDNGNPPSESFMRDLKITKNMTDSASKYEDKDYFNVPPDIDSFASAIESGNGLAFAVDGSNPGWQTADVRKPLSDETIWGHAIFGIGHCMRNGKKCIIFSNHWGKYWGDNGLGYLSEDYFQPDTQSGGIKINRVYQGWTLLPKINKDNMIFQKEKNNSSVYLIVGNKKIMIIDMPTLQALDGQITEVDSLAAYLDGGTLVWCDRIIN